VDGGKGRRRGSRAKEKGRPRRARDYEARPRPRGKMDAVFQLPVDGPIRGLRTPEGLPAGSSYIGVIDVRRPRNIHGF
jgi:hypothetical protein